MMMRKIYSLKENKKLIQKICHRKWENMLKQIMMKLNVYSH